MRNVFRWNGTITMLSPLSHNSDETMGVDTKFRRMDMITPSGKRSAIPVYSGNAFRGILRRIAAKQYLEALSMYDMERIDPRLYYLFFSGGSLEKGSEQGYIEVGSDKRFREMVPFMSLFGGGRGNRLHHGKLKVGIAIPIAKETVQYTGVESEKSVWELFDEIYYTRRDDIEDRLMEGDDGFVQAQQMKYTVECLIPGAVLQHTIVLELPTELELSCMGAIWREFAEKSILGGMSGRGHGKVALDYAPEFPDPEPYLTYLRENKEAILKSEAFDSCRK